MKLREWMYSMREIYHDVAVQRSDKHSRCKAYGMKNTYKLISEEEDGLEAELAMTEVEQVLKRGAQEINDHRIVVALGAEPTDEGHTNAASEGLVNLGLVLELGMLGFDRLELDGDLLTRDDVDSQVDVTCKTV